MLYFAGIATGYVLTGVVLLWVLGIGTAVGFFTACLFAGGKDDRCMDTDCPKRLR